MSHRPPTANGPAVGAPAIGPAAGGLLLGTLGAWAPGVVGAVIMAWAVIYVWRRLIVNPDPPLPGRGETEATQEPVQAHP